MFDARHFLVPFPRTVPQHNCNNNVIVFRPAVFSQDVCVFNVICNCCTVCVFIVLFNVMLVYVNCFV